MFKNEQSEKIRDLEEALEKAGKQITTLLAQNKNYQRQIDDMESHIEHIIHGWDCNCENCRG